MSKIGKNQAEINQINASGKTYKTTGELTGGLGKGWTTCTTLGRIVSGRVAEKPLT